MILSIINNFLENDTFIWIDNEVSLNLIINFGFCVDS